MLNQIMSNLGLGQMTGQSQENQNLGTRTPTYKGRKGYPRTLREQDFLDATVDISGGKFELLGYFTVGAKQFAEIGQGDPTLDPAEQGRPQIEIVDDASTTLSGVVRLTHESAQGTQEYKVIQDDMSAFNISNRNQRLVLSRASVDGYPRVGEDSKIGLWFNADTTGSGTVSRSNSTVRIPSTIYE